MRMVIRAGVISVVLGLAVGCDRKDEEEMIEEVMPQPRRSEGSDDRSAAAPELPSPVEPATSAAEPSVDQEAPPAAEPGAALLDPASLTEQAPARYTVRLDTSEGSVHIDVHRSWAPRGADRFYNLVKAGYFTDVAFFRVIDGFMAQLGIHGDPRVNAAWRSAAIQDDPVTQRNTRGMVTYATSGPNSRTTQFFINFADNSNLDAMGFAPFGQVRDADMAVVDRLHAGYGEGAPRGRGPRQDLLQSRGNEYLRAQFPDLDYVRSAEIVAPGR